MKVRSGFSPFSPPSPFLTIFIHNRKVCGVRSFREGVGGGLVIGLEGGKGVGFVSECCDHHHQ